MYLHPLGPEEGIGGPAFDLENAPQPAGRKRLDLEAALDRLLGHTGAAAAELFLINPGGDEIVMAAQAGHAVRAFRERTWFTPGEGFPGIVGVTRVPLVCPDLAADARFLRQAVVRKGFRSFLGVPVWGRTFLGVLNVVFRRKDVDLEALISVVSGAAARLGLAIELERLRVADEVRAFLLDPALSAQGNFEMAARTVLDALMEAAGATGGMVMTPDSSAEEDGHFAVSAASDPGRWTIAAERGLPPSARRAVSCGVSVTSCAIWQAGSCRAQGGGLEWVGSVCRAVGKGLSSMICLPLPPGAGQPGERSRRSASRPAAVVVLGFDRPLPFPTVPLTYLHEALPAAFDVLQGCLYLLRAAGPGVTPSSAAGDVSALARTGGRTPEMEASQASMAAWSMPEWRAQPPKPERAGGPLLDIRCLGPFRLAIGTAVVPPESFRRRHSLKLLKLLLIRDGARVHRDELIELLWPASPPDRVRPTLATAFHHLRHAVVGPGGRPIPFAVRDGDLYSLDRDLACRLDLREFQKAAEAGDRLARQGHEVEALVAYRRAQELYSGPLFQDESAEDWALAERAHLEARFLDVLRAKATLHWQAGDLESAIGCYRRALRTDPTLEDLHLALMRALSRAGRRTEALRQFEELCSVLAREFDTIPLPETQELYDQLSSNA